MTLFTANALLFADTRRRIGAPGGTLEGATAACYQDWLRTQQEPYPLSDRDYVSWLTHVPELYHRRAPGNTCLAAIYQGAKGTISRPINQSKGCGGIMRVAPIGLYMNHPEKAGLLAAQNAAMTHGHELGYIPAGILGYCVSTLSHEENTSLLTAIQSSMDWAARQFPTAKHLPELTALVERAVSLATSTLTDEETIRTLGQGWVAEETLAIAVYCALKYEHDFDRALIAAVNHDGDSDSTGAVTGNLLGAYLGLSGIPQKYQHALELMQVILELADDLCHGCPVGYGRQPIIHVVGTRFRSRRLKLQKLPCGMPNIIRPPIVPRLQMKADRRRTPGHSSWAAGCFSLPCISAEDRIPEIDMHYKEKGSASNSRAVCPCGPLRGLFPDR